MNWFKKLFPSQDWKLVKSMNKTMDEYMVSEYNSAKYDQKKVIWTLVLERCANTKKERARWYPGKGTLVGYTYENVDVGYAKALLGINDGI